MANDLQIQPKLSSSRAAVVQTTGARQYVIALAVVATIIGALYLFYARPGSAGDEPAHYANVIYYARHKCMPILGQPEVSYEGQMGPVYYALSAPVWLACAGLGEHEAFFALRIFDLLLVPLTVFLSYRLASIAKPEDKTFVLATTTFMALNPSLLSIAASIQNDALTCVLTMAISLLCFKFMQDDTNLIRKGVLIGLLTGVAILTKATAVFLVAAIPVYAVVCWRWRSAKFIAAFGSAVGLSAGWWFVRNVVLYGDLSAQAALTKFNYNNNPPPFDFREWPKLRHFLWETETYYWMPIQYYRDVFHTPIWLRSIVGIFTALGLIGAFGIVVKHVKDCLQNKTLKPFFPLFMATQYAVCMLVFIYSCARITHFAARVTFPTIIIYAAIIASGCFVVRKFKQSEKAFLALLAAGMIAANVYVLTQLNSMPVLPFHHIFSVPPYL